MAEPTIKLPPAASSDWFRPLRRGGGAVVVALLGLWTWAAFAPLDSAVMAPGQVAVENSRQTIQHLEGGIIKEIHVRDGQLVQSGDLLFRMDETQARATFETLSNQLGVFLAREARLMAERENASQVVFAPEILQSNDANVRRAIADEQANFRERAGLKKVQLDVLENRIATFQREIEGLREERESSQRQIKLIDQELVGLRDLFTKQLVPLTRLNTLERERERLVQLLRGL